MPLKLETTNTLLALLLSVLFCSHAWGLEAEVIFVPDGDTIHVRTTDKGKRISLRLYGIDAPERPGKRWRAQPFSRNATDFLRALLPKGSRIGIQVTGVDKYGRTLGIALLPDGEMAQEKLLSAGYAWVYPTANHKYRQKWLKLEQEARAKKLGLWRDGNPVPPWKWRKGKR